MTEVMEGQISLFDLDIWSGRMSPAHSVPTTAKTSESSLKRQPKSQTRMPLFLELRGSGHKQDASWEMGGALLGEYTMHSFGEFRNGESAYVYLLTSTETPQERYCLNCGEKPLTEIQSKLSQILESNPDPRYYLSARACAGILNRAKRRNKPLPDELREALERQMESDPSTVTGDADSRNVFDARGNGGGGLTPTITGDHQNRITDYTAIIVEHSRKSGFTSGRKLSQA